jgi:hypothetical protein
MCIVRIDDCHRSHYLWQDVSVAITDFRGTSVAVSLLPVASNASLNSAVFSAFMPAAGYSTYFIEFSSSDQPQPEPVGSLDL